MKWKPNTQDRFNQDAADAHSRRLSRILIAKKGKPDFLILEKSVEGAKQDATRRSAADASLAAAELSVTEVNLLEYPNTHALEDALRQLAAQGVGAVHLLNADRWLTEPESFGDAGSMSHAHAMNLARENLFQIPLKLLLWVLPQSIDILVREAPDLFAWRAGIYVLGPGPVYTPAAPSPPTP